jgi:hypothetical protein
MAQQAKSVRVAAHDSEEFWPQLSLLITKTATTLLVSVFASIGILVSSGPSTAIAQVVLGQPKPYEYADPKIGIPLDSDVSKSYVSTRRILEGYLRRPCLDATSRDQAVASAKAMQDYLVKWSISWAVNPYQKREASDWSEVIGGLAREIQAKKDCPPGSPGTTSTPTTPGTTTPGTTTTTMGVTDAQCEALSTEYYKLVTEAAPIQTKITILEGDQNVAKGITSYAEQRLEYVEDYKKDTVTYANDYKTASDAYNEHVKEQAKKGEGPRYVFLMPSPSNIQATEQDEKAALEKAKLEIERIEGLLEVQRALLAPIEKRMEALREQIEKILKCQSENPKTPPPGKPKHSTSGSRREKGPPATQRPPATTQPPARRTHNPRDSSMQQGGG